MSGLSAGIISQLILGVGLGLDPPPPGNDKPDPTASSPPPIPNPPPPGKIAATVIAASVEFENGEVINITEEEIQKEMVQTPDQSRLDYFKLKYEAMAKLIGAAMEKGETIGLDIYDPSMKIIYKMNMAAGNDSFDEKAIQIIEEEIQALSEKNTDKPYLLALFALSMLKSRKIPLEKAEKLLGQAVQLAPEDLALGNEVYQFYLNIGKFDEAYKMLQKIASRLPADDPRPKIERGKFFVLRSEEAKTRKEYTEALKWLEKAEESFKAASEPELSLALADLSRMKAEIYLLQEEYYDAYKALEFSAEKYEEMVEKDPENAGLLMRLLVTYLLLLKANRDLPGYQPYLKYSLSNCPYKAENALKEAEKYIKGEPQLLLELAHGYIALGKLDEAIAVFQKLSNLDPDHPLYLLQLGDLFLTKGEIDTAFEYYEKASQKAKETRKLEFLSEVLLRFSFLKMQSELGLAQLKAGQPNAAQASLNVLGLALLSYLNPFMAVTSMIGMGAKGALNKNYTEAEFKTMIEKLQKLEMSAFDEIYLAVEEEENPIILYVIAEAILSRTNQVLEQVREMEKGLTSEEDIKAYKEIIKNMRDQAIRIFEFTLSKSFTKKLEAGLLEAQKSKDGKKMLALAQNYFTLYSFLQEKSKTADKALKELVEEKRDQAFEKGVEILEEILEYSEDENNLELAVGVYHISSMVQNRLFEDSSPSGKKEFKKRMEELTEVKNDSNEAAVEIAAEKKDLDSLLEMGKAVNGIGSFAIEAISEAIDLAGEDKEKLSKIGWVLYDIWRAEEPEELIRAIAAKNALQKQAVSLWQELLEKAEGEGKVLPCRMLWMFGEQTQAYLGYVALVNYYKEKKDQKMLGNIYYELGLMAAARGKKEKAVEWLKRSLTCPTDNEDEKINRELELEYAEGGEVPEWFVLPNSPVSLTPQQIRSAMALYADWWKKNIPDQELDQKFEYAVLDLYFANHRKAKVEVTRGPAEVKVEIKEETLDKIEIIGNKKVKKEVILRELGYAGLKEGQVLSTDLSELDKSLSEASNRIKSFTLKDSIIVNKEEKNVLVVAAEEKDIEVLTVGGGGGTAQALISFEVGHKSLFGGGEKIGTEFFYQWYYPKGYSHFQAWNGRLYYFDPHLFVLGKEAPVAGGVSMVRNSRMNFEQDNLETITGVCVPLEVKVARGTTLSVSPQFYYVQSKTSYYQPSLRIALEKDGRDNWRFPQSGYYLITSVEPGMYITDINQFFAKNNNEARGYIPLPGGLVLAGRGVFGMGYNLFGGDKYFLGGGMMNPYVRASDGGTSTGFGILAANLELRAPLINGGKNFKAQFYGFGDAGMIPGNGIPLFGTGGGVRVLLPLVGIMNIGYGFPGGIFLWFGDMGWN